MFARGSADSPRVRIGADRVGEKGWKGGEENEANGSLAGVGVTAKQPQPHHRTTSTPSHCASEREVRRAYC